uniref:Uncharacterized protein n=1 Tax=Steinernema glaseri TaxID=37863 RepID=A0A1I8AKF9_9BILA
MVIASAVAAKRIRNTHHPQPLTYDDLLRLQAENRARKEALRAASAAHLKRRAQRLSEQSTDSSVASSDEDDTGLLDRVFTWLRRRKSSKSPPNVDSNNNDHAGPSSWPARAH